MSPDASTGWFKATRSAEAMELIAANPRAFVLAYVIASRARWSGQFNRHNLNPGEAFVGDHSAMGMTEKEYRTAKKHLEQWGFAAFRGTNKGTVASLTDSRLFQVSPDAKGEQEGEPRADEGRTEGGPRATNKEGKKVRMKEEEGKRATARPSVESIVEKVPSPHQTPRCCDLWMRWVSCRLGKKREDWTKLFGGQREKLAAMPEPDAVTVLDYSTVNRYAGLFFDRVKPTAPGTPLFSGQSGPEGWLQ